MSSVDAWATCPEGHLEMDGFPHEDTGQVFIMHGGEVLDSNDAVRMTANNGRTYFGLDCQDDSSPTSDLLALNLLDRVFSFDVDMGQAGCNCNVALYMISMKQNDEL